MGPMIICGPISSTSIRLTSFSTTTRTPWAICYLLSSGLLTELDKRGPDFMPFYRAMLRDTGRDTVDGIVRRHCGADAANPAFWETAMQAPLAAVKAFAALSSSK